MLNVEKCKDGVDVVVGVTWPFKRKFVLNFGRHTGMYKPMYFARIHLMKNKSRFYTIKFYKGIEPVGFVAESERWDFDEIQIPKL